MMKRNRGNTSKVCEKNCKGIGEKVNGYKQSVNIVNALLLDSPNFVYNVSDFNQHGLNCIYTNANSLLNKLDEFKSRFLQEKPDIKAITEVIPKNMRYVISKAELDLKAYKLFPSSFPGKAKRGIVIYIKSTLKACEVDIDSEFSESVWIKIPLLGHDKLLFGCVYKSPSSSEEKHV